MRGGRETIAPRGSMSSTRTQATGSRAVVLDRDHEGDRLADLGLGPVAVAGRLEVRDPRPGEEPADQHQAQQGEHRAGEQPEVEDDRDDEDADDGDEPSHQAMTLAPLVGTGTVSSSSSTTDAGRDLAQPALGLEDDPVAQDGRRQPLDVVGRDERSCPRIAASACDAR